MNSKGFSLLELLVVITIIGILATVVLSNSSDSRREATDTANNAQLVAIRTAILRLVADTGKGPNGCILGDTSNPEVALNNAQAGLTARPTPGTVDTCTWSTAEVAKWNGPYFTNVFDPWGNTFYFDPDYFPWQSCASIADEPVTNAIVSLGPDTTYYTCDDIFLKLEL